MDNAIVKFIPRGDMDNTPKIGLPKEVNIKACSTTLIFMFHYFNLKNTSDYFRNQIHKTQMLPDQYFCISIKLQLIVGQYVAKLCGVNGCPAFWKFQWINEVMFKWWRNTDMMGFCYVLSKVLSWRWHLCNRVIIMIILISYNNIVSSHCIWLI